MKLLLSLLLLLAAGPGFAQTTVRGLLTENLEDPIGIETRQPRFSWQLQSPARNLVQTAYEIKVSDGKASLWNSGKIASNQSVHVVYAGNPLQPGRKYNWQVRVWDNKGKTSLWKSANFQTGFFSKEDWKGKWIMPGYQEDPLRASPLMRKEFAAHKQVASATAFITAHGIYEAMLNGQRIGDAWLTPGWTSYKKRLQYQVYDVTGLVKQGNNAVAVKLGSGWYRGIIGFSNSVNVYGKDVALLFQLQINYTDGSTATVVSDNSWKTATGEITYSEIYNGEIIDARKARKGWELAGYNDGDWKAAKDTAISFDNLVATENEMVKMKEEFKPVKIFTTPKGEKVIDFGQNLVGWVIVKANGKAGDSITLSHAEILDKRGNFYTANLRAAKQQNTYVLNGGGEERFHPHFTWQGFRYLKIEGYPGEIKPENFTAVALYSDMKPTGNFSSSHPLINQLQHNIQWGQKGNFLDVPTDCPQRDERLGWTGDAQAFSRTAAFNMNVNSFFSKWLKDLEADQQEGVVPFVIPNVLGGATNSTGWADAATIIPWNMYLAYGDKQILQNQYSSMKAYVESIRRISPKDLWNTGFHFGDWLFFRPEDDNDGRSAVTDKYLIAQSFYAHSVQLLINTANVLGKKEDAAAYGELLKRVKAAYVNEYLTPNGRLVSGTQTAYVLALNFDMLPENQRRQAADRLVENIKSYGNHLTTGFLGTPYLCHVLSRFGHADVAYKLLFQETYPSWLYPVKMGATTIWERWDGQKPDSSFQSTGMNSFNHYAYGAIGDWLYRVVVGLDTYEDGVGYQHSRIKPLPGGEFKFAKAELDTYYGRLSNSWKDDSLRFSMEVEIPANTRSSVFIPAGSVEAITEGGKSLAATKLKVESLENGYALLNLGSGKYSFVVTKPVQENAAQNPADFTGLYKVEGAMIQSIEITSKNGKLLARAYNNSGELEPVKGKKDEFVSADGSKVYFSRDGQGRVTGVKMNSLGMTFEGKRSN